MKNALNYSFTLPNLLKFSKLLSIGFPGLFLIFVSTSSFISKTATPAPSTSGDSLKAREILTSQQLFITSLRNLKQHQNHQSADLKANLKDAFKIICYDGDSSYTELDWTMSDRYGNPQPVVCKEGSAVYKKLDDQIIHIRKMEKKYTQEYLDALKKQIR